MFGRLREKRVFGGVFEKAQKDCESVMKAFTCLVGVWKVFVGVRGCFKDVCKGMEVFGISTEDY